MAPPWVEGALQKASRAGPSHENLAGPTGALGLDGPPELAGAAGPLCPQAASRRGMAAGEAVSGNSPSAEATGLPP